MSDLPPGWASATVGEVGHVMLGRQRAPKYHHGPNMRPYLRVKNVFEDRIDLSDVKEMDFSPADFERYRLEPGDILLNEGQSPELVGRPALYRDELPGACFTNSLIRFQPRDGIDGRFALFLFLHHLRSGRFMREARITTNIAHLSASRFSSVEFPVPPLNEQRRIVAAIEEQLSRLDAADASLTQAQVRLEVLRQGIFANAVLGHQTAELGSVTTDHRYGTSIKCLDDAEGPPVLRIPNVRDGRIDQAGLKFATATELGDCFVETGDLLFIRTNGSRDLIGRVATVDGASGMAFASYLIRARPMAQLDPRWAVIALSSPPLRSEIEQRAASTAGQYNLNLKALRSLEIPLPPLEEQRRIVAEVEQRLSAIDALRAAIERAQRRSAALRAAVLARAFRGELVPQDPSDEPASELLARLRTERAAAEPVRRSVRKKVG